MCIRDRFTTDIRYLLGLENVPADTLSRIAALQQPTNVNYTSHITEKGQWIGNTAKWRPNLPCAETLRYSRFRHQNLLWRFKHGFQATVCDCTSPPEFRRTTKMVVPPCPGVTAKLVMQKFVWLGARKDCVRTQSLWNTSRRLCKSVRSNKKNCWFLYQLKWSPISYFQRFHFCKT